MATPTRISKPCPSSTTGLLSASVCRNILYKIQEREMYGHIKSNQRGWSVKPFSKIPGRLCYFMHKLVGEDVLNAGHVFMGFSKCGNFVISYTLQIDTEDRSMISSVYTYRLHWWRFNLTHKMKKVSEIKLFGDEEMIQLDLYIAMCQWGTDQSKLLVYGCSMPSSMEESRHCHITITSVPPISTCRDCTDIQRTVAALDSDELGNNTTTTSLPRGCLKHNFTVHTKYQLAPPYPTLYPRISLKSDNLAVLNSGDSIIALCVCVNCESVHLYSENHTHAHTSSSSSSSSTHTHTPFTHHDVDDESQLCLQSTVSDDNVISMLDGGIEQASIMSYPISTTDNSDITTDTHTNITNTSHCTDDEDERAELDCVNDEIYSFHGSPGDFLLVEPSTNTRQRKISVQSSDGLDEDSSSSVFVCQCCGVYTLIEPTPSTTTTTLCRCSKCNRQRERSPVKRTRSLYSTQQQTPLSRKQQQHFTKRCTPTNTTTTTSSRRVCKLCKQCTQDECVNNTSKQQQQSDSDKTEIYKHTDRLGPPQQQHVVQHRHSKLQTHSQKHQLNVTHNSDPTTSNNNGNSSSSSVYDFVSSSSSAENSPSHLMTTTTTTTDNNDYCDNSSKQQQLGFTYSCRRFRAHPDPVSSVGVGVGVGRQLTASVNTDGSDSDYHNILPLDVHGSDTSQMILHNDEQLHNNGDYIEVKQMALDVEQYISEIARTQASWRNRFLAFTDYDMQILEVCPDTLSVVVLVYAIIRAKPPSPLTNRTMQDSMSPPRTLPRLYETSFHFCWNLKTGKYETVDIQELKEFDQSLLCKGWNPGHAACIKSVCKWQVFPSHGRGVHLMTNESVFKGQSLKMIVNPVYYCAIILKVKPEF